RGARLREKTLTSLVHSEALEDLEPGLAEAVGRFRALVAGLEERCPARPPDEVFFWLWSNLPYGRTLVDEERSRDLGAVAGLGAGRSRRSDRLARPGGPLAGFARGGAAPVPPGSDACPRPDDPVRQRIAERHASSDTVPLCEADRIPRMVTGRRGGRCLRL